VLHSETHRLRNGTRRENGAMLLHIRPRLFCPFKNVALVDLTIEPLGLQLVGGVDLATGRPYPNKRYTVAYRKQGRKAIDGILIETGNPIEEVRYTARWAIEAALLVTHRVLYTVLDREFDAASDNACLWHGYSGELGGWANRFPAGAKGLAPAAIEPMIEVVPREFDRRGTEPDYPPHKKAPGFHRGLRSVREKRTYRLTAILACRSVGRTIGNGGLVTTSLTQRASPPLK
jgi:hypothetical protein